VVDSVWRDNDDTSKGVKRRFVVGIQTGETRVLALNKLVEELEDVARERFERFWRRKSWMKMRRGRGVRKKKRDSRR
jgi:hypothetical protein